MCVPRCCVFGPVAQCSTVEIESNVSIHLTDTQRVSSHIHQHSSTKGSCQVILWYPQWTINMKDRYVTHCAQPLAENTADSQVEST